MKPIGFKEATKELGPPSGVTEEECGNLPVFSDGNQTISLWKLSWRERWAVFFRGRVWVGVVSGATQPPVWMDAAKTVFTPVPDAARSSEMEPVR